MAFFKSFPGGSLLHPYRLLKPHDSLSRERHRMLYHAFLYTRGESVAGDYLEFGIAAGRSLVYSWDICRKLGLERDLRFLGFDAFQGFPEPKGVDAQFTRFVKGDACHSRKTVEDNLRACGIPAERVVLVDGWYQDTLVPATRIAHDLHAARVVNIDCDLYDSAILALEFIAPIVSDGAVILFDDWYCYRGDPDRGEMRAAREWQLAHPGIRLIRWKGYANVGQSFIVSRQKEDSEK